MLLLSRLLCLIAAPFAVLCSAALFWFGNGLHPWWPLMWFAPLPVLLYATEAAQWKSAAAVAFLALFLGGLAMWHYFRVMGAPWGWVAVYTLVATLFMGATLLFRARLRGGSPWRALLAFPATMVTCEYLLSFTPGGSAGSLANTQMNFLPFLQLASITGPYGMTFLLLGFPAALAVAWHLRRTAPQQTWRVLGVAVGMVALVLVFGAVRLRQPPSRLRMKVGLAASDLRVNIPVADAGPDSINLFLRYADAAQSLAVQGAKVIVLPEKIGTVVDPDPAQSDACFQAVASHNQAVLVAGVVHIGSSGTTNQARVYAWDCPVQDYDKQHLLPTFEANRMRSGSSLTILQKLISLWGVAICKDLDHGEPARAYGQAGVGMLLVPAWDFGVDRWWHGHIAVMRGVENGFTVVRAAKEGSLYASDPYGRILGEVRSDAAPFATLLVDVPVGHVETVYQRLGNWFAFVAMAMFAWTLLPSTRAPRAGTPRSDPAPS